MKHQKHPASNIMENPKEFKATPYDHSKPVAKSGPEPKRSKTDKNHNVKATPFNHFKVIDKSASEIGPPRGIAKKETKSSPVGAGMPPVIGKSGCDGMGAPREPKKYKMPNTDDGSRG